MASDAAYSESDLVGFITMQAELRKKCRARGVILGEMEAPTLTALKLIARGRPGNGKPLGAETARRLARVVLDSLGEAWEPNAP